MVFSLNVQGMYYCVNQVCKTHRIKHSHTHNPTEVLHNDILPV